jgi:hypothetical protein
MLFLIANLPPARMYALVLGLLELGPQNIITGLFHHRRDPYNISTNIVAYVLVPLKELFVFVALLVVSIPIWRSLSESRLFWHQLGCKRIVKAAAGFCIVLSLLCTYALIFLTLVFLESKLGVQWVGEKIRENSMSPNIKWLVKLSVLTSSFVLVSFQRPGFPEQLVFILALLMASLPMTPKHALASWHFAASPTMELHWRYYLLLFSAFPRRKELELS